MLRLCLQRFYLPELEADSLLNALYATKSLTINQNAFAPLLLTPR